MTEQEIHTICEKYNIKDYTINPDGSIDVNDDVDLSYINLSKIPLNFNKVSGGFYCYSNQLTSLIGSPKEVGGDFDCSNNQLTSLEGCPKYVGGNFYFYHNQLTSLNGYNGDYNNLLCDNKEKLVRKTKLKILETI